MQQSHVPFLQNAENRNYLDEFEFSVGRSWNTGIFCICDRGNRQSFSIMSRTGRYASMTEAESYTKVIYDEKAL